MPEPISPCQAFLYCPRCGASRHDIGANPLRCQACDFTWFFNPTCAAGVFLFRDDDGRCLFIRRAHEPRKGTLAVPGGFIDAGESAEVGLQREVREEVGLEIDELQFVISCPNRYEYRGLVYDVCDFIFTAKAHRIETATALDGVEGIEWHRLDEVNEDEIAFPSLRAGRAELLRKRR